MSINFGTGRGSNYRLLSLLTAVFGLGVLTALTAAEDERTALAKAAELGNAKEFAALLQQRPYPDLDAAGNDGRTALHLLVANDMLGESQALVAKSDELQEKARDLREQGLELPADIAINAGGIDVSARSVHEFTPLHIAARSGNAKVAAFLLGQGAFVNATDQYKRTPLHGAAELGHLKTVAILRRHLAYMSRDRMKRLPLHLAAMSGHLEVVRMLLPDGRDRLNYDVCRDKKGLTLLHYAAKRGDVPMVKLLLNGWQTAAAVSFDKATPLHLAAANGHDQVIAYLLQADADVNAEDADGKTPLDEAGQDSVKQLLIAAGGLPGK